MLKVIEQVEFTGDFSEFLQFLRTDPKFYPTNAGDYLKETAYILKRMDGELPKLFLNLPPISHPRRQPLITNHRRLAENLRANISSILIISKAALCMN